MSGHSKWSQIKHKKAAEDVKKGKVFSKLGKMITIAARENPAVEANPTLRTLVEKAKAMNMPKLNIDRAIQKATAKDSVAMEDIIYEAFGPGNIAILIEAITDNRNRSVNNIKHILDINNGKFAQKGSVEWMFKKVMTSELRKSGASLDDLELAAIDAGALDTQRDEESNTLTAFFEPSAWEMAKHTLTYAGIALSNEELTYVPTNPIEVDDAVREQLEKLSTALEEDEDVEELYVNAA
jgi:YebC/PmpR family DNA-binding regulatory protein